MKFFYQHIYTELNYLTMDVTLCNYANLFLFCNVAIGVVHLYLNYMRSLPCWINHIFMWNTETIFHNLFEVIAYPIWLILVKFGCCYVTSQLSLQVAVGARSRSWLARMM